MEPQRGSRATLEDLVERVLDKGIVLKLDLIIGVAGIPLIGISLQGAIAAIETMLEYGMMEAWDADTRAYAIREERRREFGFQPGEHPVLELYGSYYRSCGISRVWQPGRLILTDRRLLLVRSAPPEVLFETLVSAVAGIGRVVHENLGRRRREIVSLALADGTVAVLYAAKPEVLEARLREGIQRLGQAVTEIPACATRAARPGRGGGRPVVAPLGARARLSAVEVRLGGADRDRTHLAPRPAARCAAARAAHRNLGASHRTARAGNSRGARRARRDPRGRGGPRRGPVRRRGDRHLVCGDPASGAGRRRGWRCWILKRAT